MRGLKKTAVFITGLALSLCGISFHTFAADSAWSIDNTLNTPTCAQGDAIILSVNLKGTDETSTQEIAYMEGVLEYDKSLFSVGTPDIFPTESGQAQGCSFDPSTGRFTVQYASPISLSSGKRMLQIQLHTTANALIGKTTICVTQMKWSQSPGLQDVEIEHHIPARIEISKAKFPNETGDVNRDGTVDLTDARLVIKYFNGGKKLGKQQKKNADVNADGKVDLTDAKLIMKYYNGEISEFPNTI